MSPETLQLGAVVAITMALIEIIKIMVNKLSPTNSGGVYGSKLDAEVGKLFTRMQRTENDIQELRTNHLHHQERIESALLKIAVKLQIDNLFD